MEPTGNVRVAAFAITNVDSRGEPVFSVMVCVAAPIVPVALFASVTTTVRVVPVPLRASHSGTAMLPAGSVRGSASAGLSVHVTGVPNATVTAASAPGGVRESTTEGELRRYNGFVPDEGIAEGDTISCGAAGAAPGPPGFVTVAELFSGVPGAVPAAIRTSNTIVVLPLAGTAIPRTSTRPVPLAPVPTPVEKFVAPAGTLTTLSDVNSAARSSTTDAPLAATPFVSRSVIV